MEKNTYIKIDIAKLYFIMRKYILLQINCNQFFYFIMIYIYIYENFNNINYFNFQT